MAKVLIDTNILIYAMDSQSRFNHATFGLFQEIEDGEFQAFISERSLYEMVAVLTSPAFIPRVNIEQIKEYLQYLTGEYFTILYTNPQVTSTVWRLLFNLLNRKNRIYDLVLAATAIVNDVDIIYTKNVKDFENIKEIKIVDPTSLTPETQR